MSGNVYDQSAAATQGAGLVYGNIAQGGMPAQSMNAYLNPYQSQVIDDTTSRLTDAYNQNIMNVGDRAIASNAFGGSRHGVVEAATTDDYLRNLSETTGRLNQQGFNTALNAGFQDVNQQMQAAQGLLGSGAQGFDMARAIQGDQIAQGGLQQQLLQAILSGGSQQFGGYINHPNESMRMIMGALSGNPLQGESTQQYKPGLFDYLSLAFQTAGKVGQGAFAKGGRFAK